MAEVSAADVAKLSAETNFSEDEIRALHKRYESMRSDGKKGSVEQTDFQRMFGLGTFEANRLFALFSNHAPTMTFHQLCRGLSAFSPNASSEEKVQASFDFFDAKGDGKIDYDELSEVFQQFLQDNAMHASPEQVQAIVAHTMKGFGVERDGSIDLPMFQDMVEHHPQLIAALTISTWQLTT